MVDGIRDGREMTVQDLYDYFEVCGGYFSQTCCVHVYSMCVCLIGFTLLVIFTWSCSFCCLSGTEAVQVIHSGHGLRIVLTIQ